MGRVLQGTVVSDKSDKTIVVSVSTRKTHPIYKKSYSVSKRYKAHDEKNEAKTGQEVLISETKPISKHKRWTLKEVVSKGKVKHEAIEVEAAVEKKEAPKPVPKKKKTKEAEESTDTDKKESK